ncbi:MAG: endonuclease [Methylocystaceae bacterium]|nr:endonuclease [Methylocystaceae bacterium]
MRHYISFWNVENLFAPENYVAREPWIKDKNKNDLAGWTEALFDKKINQLASVITFMNDAHGPDILGVCEVENRYVLEKLRDHIAQIPGGREYEIVHANSELDHRGIDTAFLYDPQAYSVNPDTIFSHFVLRRTGTRDILQATFTTTQGGNDLVLMCNHWPSRSGGAVESAGFRATAGETLSYWHERILEECGNHTALLAFGDFNDDPFDNSIIFNALATRERGDVERAESPKLYNLAWNYLKQTTQDHMGNDRSIDGTLYYKGNGNVFDQILVNRPLVEATPPFAVLENTAKIELYAPMVSHRVGEGPIRFGLPKGNVIKNVNENGFSDHFPVSVQIEEI